MASDFIADKLANTEFNYSVRVSAKAKHAKLQIRPYRGLEVVIPPYFSRSSIPDLINQHADWIRQRLDENQHHLAVPDLPNEVYLSINQSTTPFEYALKDTDLNFTILCQWVRKQAWEILPPMLEKVSSRCQLDYSKLSIRSQKTRWGSCSSRGAISLNDQLLFVPAKTAEYLMIHELCHTKYMNHSAKFWALVEKHCADYRQHEAVLNNARTIIPDWYQYSLSQ